MLDVQCQDAGHLTEEEWALPAGTLENLEVGDPTSNVQLGLSTTSDSVQTK